jgi:hypothetical protein
MAWWGGVYQNERANPLIDWWEGVVSKRDERMAYNERLAERIRGYFKRRRGVDEKRMLDWLCFMLNGHMCCGSEKTVS